MYGTSRNQEDRTRVEENGVVNIKSWQKSETAAEEIMPMVMWKRSNLPENTIHNTSRMRKVRMNVVLKRFVGSGCLNPVGSEGTFAADDL
jgi:hypothetical protein